MRCRICDLSYMGVTRSFTFREERVCAGCFKILEFFTFASNSRNIELNPHSTKQHNY